MKRLLLFLLLCSCGSGGTEVIYKESNDWPIAIPIYIDGYIYVDVVVNGEEERALFDTGAPATFLDPHFPSAATICAGNFCSDIAVYDLAPGYEWTGGLIGLPWLQAGGVSEFTIDVDNNLLRAR